MVKTVNWCRISTFRLKITGSMENRKVIKRRRVITLWASNIKIKTLKVRIWKYTNRLIVQWRLIMKWWPIINISSWNKIKPGNQALEERRSSVEVVLYSHIVRSSMQAERIQTFKPRWHRHEKTISREKGRREDILQMPQTENETWLSNKI